MEKYTLKEIEEYLYGLGLVVISEMELEYLEEKNLNHPG